jgi:hypothetical protein
MLALVHPDVVWKPLTRPGRSRYLGHVCTQSMLDDFRQLTKLADGRVMAHGKAV